MLSEGKPFYGFNVFNGLSDFVTEKKMRKVLRHNWQIHPKSPFDSLARMAG